MAIDCLSGVLVGGGILFLLDWEGENALHLYPETAN